jgi:2-amino-4-hydroxy-6-hydroxymethyldihydropteridine diphosphokinase
VTRAVLSVGSNLGDRLAHLRSVLVAAGPALVAASGVYETAPWGVTDQDDFLNAVLIVDDQARDAGAWLAFCHDRERAAGRVRDRRWGPRTLDADVVDVDASTSDDPALTLPHPRAAERAFVLVPWLDADPSARLSGRPVAELVALLPAAELDGVRRRPDLALS